MSDNAIIPAAPVAAAPRADVTIREATVDDIPFIDALQKAHRKQVGFMHLGTLEGKIAAREVLVAEEMRNDECGMRNEEHGDASAPQFSIPHSAFAGASGT
jgi:hypothetical protein